MNSVTIDIYTLQFTFNHEGFTSLCPMIGDECVDAAEIPEPMQRRLLDAAYDLIGGFYQ